MDRQEPLAGGFFIAAGAVGGVLVGRLYGETSIGLLVGLATGATIALLLWWKSR